MSVSSTENRMRRNAVRRSSGASSGLAYSVQCLCAWQFGIGHGKLFFTGLIELSLSVDNLFVFLLNLILFQGSKYQHRVVLGIFLGDGNALS
jgi:hypothetical protein